MAAILATVDIEDLATPKIAGIKDALTELNSNIESFASSMRSLTGSLQGPANALGESAAQSSAAAQGFKEVQTAVDALIPPVENLTGAVVEYLNAIAQQTVALAASLQQIQIWAGGLTALAQTLQAGTQATEQQAAALRELGAAAQEGQGFTAEQAQTLTEINDAIAQGLPLTQQQVQALSEMAQEYALANREATGYDEALKLLIQDSQQQAAAFRELATGMDILTQQLRAGEQATGLQKAAFDEMATAAQSLAQFTDEDKRAFIELNTTLQETGALTAEQVTELQRLNAVTQEAVAGTQAQVSAIQELLGAEREKLALSQQAAEAAKVLSKQLEAGETATENQVGAVKELNARLQDQKGVSDSVKTSIDSLNSSIEIGQRVSAQQANQIKFVARSLNEAGEASRGAAAGFDAARAKLAVLATVLATVAAGLFGYLDSAAKLAARVEVLGTVQAVLGKNSVNTALELRMAEQQIKALGITTQEARDAVIQFTQADLKLADASKIARAAQDLAVVAGENSSQTFKRLTTAIQVQQPMLLRQVGIVTGLDQIYREYAKTIDKTVQQLTSQDKRQAFVNKILEEAAKVTGAYTMAMEDAGKKAGSLERLQEELQLTIGQQLLPAYRAWIDLLTESIKAWNDLDPAIRSAATALGVFATALATVFGLFAGAKFAAWILGFGGLTTAVTDFILAIKVGEGVLGALSFALGGPWVAALKIAGIAVAGLITYLVLWRDTAREVNEQRRNDVASMQGEIEKVAELTKQIFDFRKEQHATEAARKLNADRMKELEKLAPAVAAALQKEKVSWQELEAAIKSANAERQKSIEQRLSEVQSQIFETEKRIADLEKQRIEAQRRLAEIPATAQGQSALSVLAARKRALQEVDDELKQARKDLEAARREQFSLDLPAQRREALKREMTSGQELLTQLGSRINKLGPDAIRAAQTLNRAYANMGNGALMSFKDSTGQIIQLNEDMVKELVDTIKAANSKLEDEEMKRKARYQQIRKQELENLAGDAVASTARLDALNEALSGLADGSQEYFDVLNRGMASIAAFNKLSDEQKKKFPEVAEAAQRLKAVELGEEFKKWREELAQTSRSFDEFIDSSLRGLRDEAEETARAMTFGGERDRLTARQQSADAIRAAEEQLSDAWLNDVEKAIAAEQRLVAERERNLKREQQARELAFMEEEGQIRRKFDLIIREGQLRLDQIRKEMALRREATIDALNAETALHPERRSDVEQRKAEFIGLQALTDAALQAQEDAYEQRVRMELQNQLDLLDIRRKTGQETVDIQRSVNETLKQLGEKNLARIKLEASAAAQFLKEVLGSAMQVAGSTLLRMLAGVQSWADGFKSILRSLRDSFFSFVDSLLKKWIDGFIKKLLSQSLTQGAGSNLLGGLLGRLGLGGLLGGAATAATPAIGAQALGLAAGGGIAGASTIAIPAGAAPAAVTSGAAGAGGMGALGAGAIGGAAGFGAGFLVGKLTGSRTAGALAGAGTGALTGLMIGGPVGALIGGAIGLIGGLMGGGEAGRVKKAREELMKAAGGVEQLKAQAERAGYSMDKLLNTKKMKEFNLEVKKLQTALQFPGGMNELRKQAQLVGEDIDAIFNIKKAEDFEAALKRVNAKLEEQKRLVEALNVAAQGVNIRAEGFKETIGKDFQTIFEAVGKRSRLALQKGFEAAQKRGFEGTFADFFADQLKRVSEGQFNNFKLSAHVLELYRQTIAHTQEDFESLGAEAAGTFALILRNTGSLVEAMEAIAPTLDTMIEMQDKFGLESTDTFRQLLNFRRVVDENKDVAKSISGLTQLLKGLTDAGVRADELFKTIGKDLANQFDRLQARGVDTQTSLLMLQPALQKLWEAQQRFPNLKLDDRTQALLDLAKAQGYVGDQFRETGEKMLKVLVEIAKALGVTRQELEATGAVARTTFDGAADSVDALNYGNSPGGIAGITEELVKAQAQLDSFHRTAVANMRETEQVVNQTATALGSLRAPEDFTFAVPDLAEQIRNSHREDNVLRALGPITREPEPEGQDAPVIPPTVVGGDGEAEVPLGTEGQVVINMPISIDASALDGKDMVRVFNDQIAPQLRHHMEHNTLQLTSYMAQRLARYPPVKR